MLLGVLAAAQIALVPVDCRFEPVSMQFAGTPLEQARCLLREVVAGGGAQPERELPPTLAALIGTQAKINPAKLATELRRQAIAVPAATPVSETLNHHRALYFVIHDTSSPWLGSKDFPPRFDQVPRFNDVSDFMGKDAVAHLFNDRLGHVTVGHDLEAGALRSSIRGSASPFGAASCTSRICNRGAKTPPDQPATTALRHGLASRPRSTGRSPCSTSWQAPAPARG